jgi:fluoride ion exporter CrcB/FEX
MTFASRDDRRGSIPKTGNLVVSIGFLATITTAMTIPLMTYRFTQSPSVAISVLNIVVLSLIVLWIIKFT